MKKILVIGEECKDQFVYGDAKRISPEAPVAVLTRSWSSYNPGMAANVVENLKALDNNVEIEKIFQEEFILKTRYIDQKSNHMFLRVDEGDEGIQPLTLTEQHIELIKQADAVIVSDYDKGFLTEDTLLQIGQLAKMSVLDSKKRLSSTTISSYSFVKLNESEFKNNYTEDHSLLSKMIITLGGKGAKYMSTLYSVEAKETIDVSGAGDTFVAALTLNYLKHQDIDMAITFANEMSSIVVSKRGVATP